MALTIHSVNTTVYHQQGADDIAEEPRRSTVYVVPRVWLDMWDVEWIVAPHNGLQQ